VGVTFRETTTICIERPVGTGEAVEYLQAQDNPFLATLGLRVEPAPVGAGVELRLAVGIRSVPMYIYKTVDAFREAMWRNVQQACAEGLSGWQATDCVVTLHECGYSAPDTTAADFRKLTPLVLLAALQRAGTAVCEPIVKVGIEIPPDTVSAVLAAV